MMTDASTGNVEQSALLSVIDSLPVATVIAGPDLTIRHINPAFTRLTGFELEDVKGTRAPYLWWPREYHQEYLDELNVVKQGKKHKTEWLFRAKAGHRFRVKVDVNRVVKDGQVQYMIACWTDVSEYKT
jgi:PAS domain S-box-containing protein